MKAGKIKIYAPEGFLENFIAENVFAGSAMGRRAAHMFGSLVAPGPQGTVTAGLGVTTSSGTVTLIPPTDLITKTGEKRVIDGIEYEFLMAPGSEALSEMMWYLPKFKLINTAEDATHTMHNLYTLREHRWFAEQPSQQERRRAGHSNPVPVQLAQRAISI